MWYESIYYSDNIKEKEKNKIIKKINKNKYPKDIYCLCLTNKVNFQLEILETKELKKEKEKMDLKIIGIAKGKEEAFELTKIIVQEIYEKTRKVIFKEYFKFGEHNEKVC
ncbi:hypothetical protein EDC18_101134 [Natranaerovirga pectinivora]|uniref:Uncharacterized protein n=2 Tax=Natranaerovirga pectinivora TaxID=682400 RepID=A0A4R3MRL9_9FIRM|nr:hypothetical protein EDC18_101134 [Natranaerovirga pectinivora]